MGRHLVRNYLLSMRIEQAPQLILFLQGVVSPGDGIVHGASRAAPGARVGPLEDDTAKIIMFLETQ